VWVISRKKIREFAKIHPKAEAPLRRWFRVVEDAEWKSFEDARRTFGRLVDRVGKCYVFNIHGNDYRLIAKISSRWKKVWIRDIMTHEVYSRGKWKKNC
jgi:mRNA interferase HigB